MNTRFFAAVVVVVVVVLGVPASASAAGGDISYSCTPGASNCTGWYTNPVTAQFVITPNQNNSVVNANGCGDLPVSGDTPDASQTCSATFKDPSGGMATLSATVHIQKDSTPPAISGLSVRGPDANGWYNHPLSIGVNATDATSGIASCNSLTYSGPDTTSGSFSGSCTDNPGTPATR